MSSDCMDANYAYNRDYPAYSYIKISLFVDSWDTVTLRNFFKNTIRRICIGIAAAKLVKYIKSDRFPVSYY